MSKRKKKSSRARSRAQRNVSSEQNQAPSSVTTAQADPSREQEYRHVTQDLKQVTILAAAMFALLFALSFFLG